MQKGLSNLKLLKRTLKFLKYKYINIFQLYKQKGARTAIMSS